MPLKNNIQSKPFYQLSSYTNNGRPSLNASLIFGFAYLLSPRYGLLPRVWRRKRHFHEESLERWHDPPPA